MTHLKAGDIAPDIEAVDHLGRPFSLKSHRGAKVILYFYPKDNTPGCTAEACDLRDNYTSLMGKGYHVVGVSADNEQSHKNFSSKFDLPFALIPDITKKVIMDYGAWGKKRLYGREYEGILRLTFIIDEAGKIENIITKVDTKNPTRQIFEALGN